MTFPVNTDGVNLSHIQYKDDGNNIGVPELIHSVDFTGSGVTATESGGTITVNIPGGGSSTPYAMKRQTNFLFF